MELLVQSIAIAMPFLGRSRSLFRPSLLHDAPKRECAPLPTCCFCTHQYLEVLKWPKIQLRIRNGNAKWIKNEKPKINESADWHRNTRLQIPIRLRSPATTTTQLP